jgi:hypothetical protein
MLIRKGILQYFIASSRLRNIPQDLNQYVILSFTLGSTTAYIHVGTPLIQHHRSLDYRCEKKVGE